MFTRRREEKICSRGNAEARRNLVWQSFVEGFAVAVSRPRRSITALRVSA